MRNVHHHGTHEDEVWGGLYLRAYLLVKENRGTWQSAGAALGLIGGLLSATLGALSTVITWFISLGDLASVLNVLSVVFSALTIPLMAAGAHCLDLMEKVSSPLAPPSRSQSGSLKQGGKHHPNLTRVLAVAAMTFLLPVNSNAQQTIFKVPTTDVLERGKMYVELDISLKPVEPRFSSLWKPYDGGDDGWALVPGNNLFIPLRNRTYGLGNYAYAEVSKTLDTRTRLTFGGYYYTSNVVAPDAQRAGGQFGFEQPVTKKLAIQADWFTGRHANGYFTPGLSYKLSPKLTGHLGYSLGNADLRRGNHFMYVEVGFNFD